jgi:hypothetical protein
MNDPTTSSGSPAPTAMERPVVFSGEPFTAALARAGVERRWLLVEVIDASNPLCWARVYTTWRDADVVAWLEAYAVAIQVDSRADAETARVLGVDASSAPTVILFRDGRERLRIPGGQSPSALLKELVRIDIADDNLALARRMLKDPERDMRDRDGLADALLRAGLLEEALGHYDWLWQHMAEVDPEMAGPRVSFTAGKIAELCKQFPAARARFVEHRDAAAAAATTDDRSGLRSCVDFVVLNKALGDDDRTLAWLDGLHGGERRALPDGLVDLWLVRLLYKRGRSADAGALIRDPLGELERRQTFASITGGLYRRVAELHSSLVAAGRDQDAAAVRDEALRIEDSPAMRAAVR